MSNEFDYALLSDEQRQAFDTWRNRVGEMLATEYEAFSRERPDMRVNASWRCDPILNSVHPLEYIEL